jgi:hypothetical protein
MKKIQAENIEKKQRAKKVKKKKLAEALRKNLMRRKDCRDDKIFC